MFITWENNNNIIKYILTIWLGCVVNNFRSLIEKNKKKRKQIPHFHRGCVYVSKSRGKQFGT